MIIRANGLMAGAVSVILGVGAHGLAGGYRPDTSQLLLLGALAVGVGAIRSAQLRREARRRARGRLDDGWASLAAALAGGQLASHLALSALGAHVGHHGDSPLLAMVGWHATALPVAVLALGAAGWPLRVLATTVGMLKVAPRLKVPGTAVPAARPVVVLHDQAPRLSVGMRAPPALG